MLDPSGNFALEPRLQAWRLGDRADGSADRHRLAVAGTLWSERIPFGWRVVDNWVRVVDQANDELFPMIADVEPQLRREVALRREAQEQARLAEERADQAEERERQTVERERLARTEAQRAVDRERLLQAELETMVARHAAERARIEREHAEDLAQLHRRLEELGRS